MSSPYPLRTRRLTLRLMRSSDAEAQAAYRNDPAVARHQGWELPFPVETAAEALRTQDDRDDLLPGGWNTLALVLGGEKLGGEVVGDVAVRLDETGCLAEIGFTVATPAQGRGYATEAASALVHDLIERLGVARVHAELDPANLASQRVLEQVGLAFESHTRRSLRCRGALVDSMTYGATAEELRAWRDRASTPPGVLRLVELTTDNYRDYAALATHHSQQRFVAPVAQSYADALFPDVENGMPVRPRMWGLEGDGEPVGFLMIAEVTEAHPEPFLWRLLVDRRHQRRGIGGLAVDALTDLLRTEGRSSLLVSWVEGAGGPRRFYENRGFVETGEHDGETGARLDLSRTAPPRAAAG